MEANRGRFKALGARLGQGETAHLRSVPELLTDLAPRFMHAIGASLREWQFPCLVAYARSALCQAASFALVKVK